MILTDMEKPKDGVGNGCISPDNKKEKESYSEIDRGYAWLVALGSCMVLASTGGITYTYGVFLTELSEYYGDESKYKFAWVGSLMSGVLLIVGEWVEFLNLILIYYH